MYESTYNKPYKLSTFMIFEHFFLNFALTSYMGNSKDFKFQSFLQHNIPLSFLIRVKIIVTKH